MSTVSRSRKRRMMNQINVVPYIDVTLVLLVIFMVTAPMTNPGVIDLPKVGQTLKQPPAPIVVTVKKDGSLEMGNKQIRRDELLGEVKAQLKIKERSVVVAADEKTSYKNVVEILDLLQMNKVEKVGLLTKPAQ